MIQYKQGNLLDVTSGVIAHGCNAQGVMGSGVAKAVKARYPGAYWNYVYHLKRTLNPLGTVNLYKVNENLFIANCITQLNYGSDGRKYVDYTSVSASFKELRTKLMEFNTHYEIHIPKLGAGLGGGDWDIISAIITDAMPNHEITCWSL